jgi:hypothetical protein
MPAHITLLYPFHPPAELTEQQISKARSCLAEFVTVPFQLTSARYFAGHLVYLPGEPEEPFRQMTLALWRLFPDRPPYGGARGDIVPHLSVAQADDEPSATAVAVEVNAFVAERLPIRGYAREAVLMDDVNGRWRVRAVFPFGG